ncbi:MAG: helix-turn-helix domain-containing protein [Acidimicrobiales bacterium]
MDKLLFTPEEAAEMLSLGRTKLFQLIGDGTLRSVRIGKCRRVPASALVELVEELAGCDTSAAETATDIRSVTASS